MEKQEKHKKRTTKKKKRSKTKKMIKKMRIGSMHGKDSVKWKPFLMHL
jgi:hypothetical protein